MYSREFSLILSRENYWYKDNVNWGCFSLCCPQRTVDFQKVWSRVIWTTLSPENYRYQIVSCQSICHRGAISFQNKSQSQACHRLLFQELCTNTKAQKVSIQASCYMAPFLQKWSIMPGMSYDNECISNAPNPSKMHVRFKALSMKHDKNTQHNLHYIALYCLLSFTCTQRHMYPHTHTISPPLSLPVSPTPIPQHQKGRERG